MLNATSRISLNSTEMIPAGIWRVVNTASEPSANRMESVERSRAGMTTGRRVAPANGDLHFALDDGTMLLVVGTG
jgi:hypothetical protein